MAHKHQISAKKGVRYSSSVDDSNPGGSGEGHRRTMDEKKDNNFYTENSTVARTGNQGRSSSTINAHQHTISNDGEHNHTVPYYVLAFIMRVE